MPNSNNNNNAESAPESSATISYVCNTDPYNLDNKSGTASSKIRKGLRWLPSLIASELIYPGKNIPEIAYQFDAIDNVKKIEVTSCKGLKSCAVEIDNSRKQRDTKKYIVYFFGAFAKALDHVTLDEQINRVALATNVSDSTNLYDREYIHLLVDHPRTKGAITAKDLVRSAFAHVKRLFDDGVAPSNIILYGHSLGGAVVAELAGKIDEYMVWAATKQRYMEIPAEKVYIFLDRTFSKTSEVATNHVDSVFKRFTPLAVRMSGWEIDVSNRFATHPHTNRFSVNYTSEEDLVIGRAYLGNSGDLDCAELFNARKRLSGREIHNDRLSEVRAQGCEDSDSSPPSSVVVTKHFEPMDTWRELRRNCDHNSNTHHRV